LVDNTYNNYEHQKKFYIFLTTQYGQSLQEKVLAGL